MKKTRSFKSCTDQIRGNDMYSLQSTSAPVRNLWNVAVPVKLYFSLYSDIFYIYCYTICWPKSWIILSLTPFCLYIRLFCCTVQYVFCLFWICLMVYIGINYTTKFLLEAAEMLKGTKKNKKFKVSGTGSGKTHR